jgi:hypothetical protein
VSTRTKVRREQHPLNGRLPASNEALAAHLVELGATASSVLAEELIARAEHMLEVASKLSARAYELRRGNGVGLPLAAVPPPDEGAPEDRSVGRLGAIDLGAATRIARDLGRFSRQEFSERSGLSSSATSKWVARLVNGGIARKEHDSLEYVYVAPPPDPPRVKAPPVEAAFVGAVVKRSAPIANSGKSFPKTAHKETNALLAKAHRAGWLIVREGHGGNGVRCTPPAGSPDESYLQLPATPSDWRAFENTRAAFRQRGLLV